MILLDCGNSQIKGQLWRHGQMQESLFQKYDAQWEVSLADWLQAQGGSHCYLASVLDAERQEKLIAVLKDQFDDSITQFVSENESLGVENGYDDPGQLGIDRWLALLAAAELIDGDCMVIDAGSAITLDLLSADGKHLGGAILPGCETSMDQFKRIFSQIDFSAPEIAVSDKPGSSTAAAIQIDYADSSIEALSELVDRWSTMLSDNPTILLGGGDAYRVQRELARSSRIVPDLVFRGMLRMVNQ